MDDRQGTIMRRLIDRLLATRARRDRELRLSEPWRAADLELHEIERAIFRFPFEEPLPPGGGARRRHASAGSHLRRAATSGRARALEGHRAR